MIGVPSAVVAILEGEPDARDYSFALEIADSALMSAATFVELCAVIQHKRGHAGLSLVDEFMELAGITVVEFSVDESQIARDAYVRFGCLNLGDCLFLRPRNSSECAFVVQGE